MEAMGDMGKLRRIIKIKNKKILPTLLLGMIAAILAVFAVIVALTDQKVMPTIYVPFEKVDYKEGDSFDKLKEGVTAKDGEGYDITDSIYVECVIPLSSGTEAKVYYVAKDSHNNMVKESRIVSYIPGEIKEDDNNTDEDEKSADDSREKDSQDENKNQPSDESSKESIEQTAHNTDTNTPADGKPVLILKTDTTTISIGTPFDITAFVKDITDDKDTRSDLFKRIMLDGDYNINQAGNYTLKVYVKDSDGNYSEKKVFLVIVQ